MKKKIYTLLCMVALMCTACGKSDIEEVVTENVDSQIETDITQEKEDQNENVNYLLGVYDNASDYKEIPMGTFIDGKQTAFCKIKMPIEYTIGATYSDGERDDRTVEEMHGAIIENVEIDNISNISNWIIAGSTSGTKLIFSVIPTSEFSIEDDKEYAQNYYEIVDKGHYAIYYIDHNEYSTADISLSYQLNENMGLFITYEGPLAKELGIDQLAHNIYDLIEVIE